MDHELCSRLLIHIMDRASTSLHQAAAESVFTGHKDQEKSERLSSGRLGFLFFKPLSSFHSVLPCRHGIPAVTTHRGRTAFLFVQTHEGRKIEKELT
jgi:hypothetical protein